jgi:hypothetical protein
MIMKKLLPIVALLFAFAGQSNANLERKVESIDSDSLVTLVGKPGEGNILEKVNGLFFRNHEPVSLRIDRETLEEYFSHTDNENASRTAKQILKNFEYLEIDSSVGGGVSIGMRGTLEAVVNHGGKDLACEVGSCPEYRSTIISKLVYDVGDGCMTTYAFRIDEGYMELDILHLGIDILAFFGNDRAKVPEIERADYALSLNGEYYALFEAQEGKIKRIGKIFDNENRKYGELGGLYGDFYDMALKSMENDALESFK